MENEVQEDVEDANNVEAKKQTLFNSASPMKVIKVCKLLDRKQRKKIMKVGFGSFLDIKCSKLFPELCKYLMDHFDPDTSALEFPEDERGIIPIIVDTVFEVLGIPKGALPVIYQYDSVSVKYVLDLLQVEDGRQPKISDIETRLTEMGTAEDPFLLLWMLYVVCFLAPTTGVRVSPNCYPSLVNVSQINKLDWCRFTINILIQTAKAKNKNCFKACMPLLMLKYVDSLVTKGIHVEAEGPRICVWTNQMVKAAIAQDTNRDGTFGILPIVWSVFLVVAKSARTITTLDKNYIIGAFKPPCDISIIFGEARNRKQVSVKKDNGKTMMVPVFQSMETISGEVSIAPVPGKRIEHMGVKIELLGQIELYFDRGNFYDFTSLVRELEIPGEIYEKKTYPFEFSSVEMPYESYNGTNVRLRYILKVTIGRNYVGNIVEYRDFCVRNYTPAPTINNSIKMEVGIEDCLHIEFEYSKSKYHLTDVIIGKIYFLLVRIKIKNMELEIRRRESTGSGSNTYVETETLAKFELMDGAPVRGESIPVRLFLTPYELTPTYRNINNKFSVKYYLNLVLVDEEDRRYFKQQEITIYRLLDSPQAS